MTRLAIFDMIKLARDGRPFNQAEVQKIDALLDALKVPAADGIGNADGIYGGFDAALPLILAHEGGYVNHPKDPGGATMKGVTQATYDGWREEQGLPRQSVRNITAEEIGAIYRRDYWDRVKGGDLPPGVAYAVFDFAVNSGVNRASRFLQRVIGTAQDGVIGPATVAAAKALPPAVIIDRLCDDRMVFLRSLDTFSTFGKGWTRRVAEVRAKAKEMAR